MEKRIVKEIRFNEFQTVHKGDTLAIIEDAEFRLALHKPRLEIELQQRE